MSPSQLLSFHLIPFQHLSVLLFSFSLISSLLLIHLHTHLRHFLSFRLFHISLHLSFSSYASSSFSFPTNFFSAFNFPPSHSICSPSISSHSHLPCKKFLTRITRQIASHSHPSHPSLLLSSPLILCFLFSIHLLCSFHLRISLYLLSNTLQNSRQILFTLVPVLLVTLTQTHITLLASPLPISTISISFAEIVIW